MRSYIYLSSDRINNIYNQLNDTNVIEVVKKSTKKRQVSTKGKFGMKAGLLNLIRGEASISGKEGKERTFEENIRSRIELEHKIEAIEEDMVFVDVDSLIAKVDAPPIISVRFTGGYYAKGLQNPEFYSSKDWDGTLPYLYKNVGGTKIRVNYSPLHFISQSAWGLVQRRLTIDGIGFITERSKKEINIWPLAFGLLIPDIAAEIF
jgi:hypothetical protein